MYLTSTNLVHYLISRGTISPEAVVAGPIQIIDFERRNRNFKVFLDGRSGLFVKQMVGLVEGPGGGIGREAAFHRLGRSRPEYAPLLDVMPGLRDHDPARHALTVEMVHPGEDLRERFIRLGQIGDGLARTLGRALGRLHAVGSAMAARPDDLAALPREKPWALASVTEPVSFLSGINSAQADLAADFSRSTELAYGMDGLARAWRPTAPIHGDLKPDNIMVGPDEDGRVTDVRFVDWELADFGDPAWDVAGLFATLLDPWLNRALADGPTPDLRAFEPAWPALESAWQGYADALELPDDRWASHRVRCVHYLGAKFLLWAFELLGTRPDDVPTASLLRELARRIMVDPGRASEELLGFGRPLASIQ